MLLETLVAVALASGWEAHGPRAIAIAGAAGDARRVYAADGGAVYRSDDGGENWQVLLTPQFADFFEGITADPGDPDRVFVWSVHAGFAYFTTRIYRTADGGKTWTNVLLILGATSCSIAIDGDAVFAAVGGFLFRSIDGGSKFGSVDVPFAVGAVDFAPDGSILAISSGTVYESRDGGAFWTPAFEFPISCSVAPDLVSDRTGGNMYALCGTVMRSPDGGATWTPLANPGAPVTRLVVDPLRPTLIYVSTNPGDLRRTDRVLVSGDEGDSWRDLDLPPGGGVNDLSLAADGTRVYAATPSGVFTLALRRPTTVAPRP
jgi:hypothetical protein